MLEMLDAVTEQRDLGQAGVRPLKECPLPVEPFQVSVRSMAQVPRLVEIVEVKPQTPECPPDSVMLSKTPVDSRGQTSDV